MRLTERYLTTIGLIAALALTPACAPAGQVALDGAAGNAQPPADPAAGSGALELGGKTGGAPREPAPIGHLDGPPRDLGNTADGDHRQVPGAPHPGRNPEAMRAGRARDRTESPSPAAGRGASTATAPPGPVEVLPGPTVSHRPVPGSATPHGPVPLVSSPQGNDPPADVAAAILGAYTAFWDSYWAAAVHPVNPDHPGIGRHSVEPLRSRTVGVLVGRVTEGIALRLPDDHGAGRIVRIEGWDSDSAEVLDCFVDTAVLYDVSTGRVHNDERATVVHLALMRRTGDAWRVAEIFEQAIHKERTDGCVMQSNIHRAPPLEAAAPASRTVREGGGVGGEPRSPS